MGGKGERKRSRGGEDWRWERRNRQREEEKYIYRSRGGEERRGDKEGNMGRGEAKGWSGGRSRGTEETGVWCDSV